LAAGGSSLTPSAEVNEAMHVTGPKARKRIGGVGGQGGHIGDKLLSGSGDRVPPTHATGFVIKEDAADRCDG